MTETVEMMIQQAMSERDYEELRRIFSEHSQEARTAHAGNGAPLLFPAVDIGDFTMTRILLEGGVTLNEKWSDITALMIAVGSDDIRVIDALLEFKADTRLRDHNGDTALHYAVMNSQLDGAKALVRAGCDINAVNENLETPLHAATEAPSSELVEFLLRNRARHDLRNARGETARDIAERMARQGLAGLLEIFNRPREIARAAVAGTSAPLQTAPKIVLRKPGGKAS